MNINPLDVPGTMFEIELLNPNPSSSRKGYRISFQVSEEVHGAFMSAREGNLRLIGRLAVAHDNDDQPAHDAVNGTKPKKEKGPHGKLWKELYLAGFVNCPGVREVIEATRETTTEPAWEVLHRVFGVGGASLAVIGPDEIFAQFPEDVCPQVQTMVEQAKRKANKQ